MYVGVEEVGEMGARGHGVLGKDFWGGAEGRERERERKKSVEVKLQMNEPFFLGEDRWGDGGMGGQEDE